METCPRCASDALVVRRDNIPPPHHARLVCLNCGRHVRWLAGPPEDFRLPFGRYKGQTLARVAREDRGYLEWIARSTTFSNGKIQEKVRRFLAGLSPARMAPAGRLDVAAPEDPTRPGRA